MSDDGLNIKLHFNENAKWHDGEPVTVDDLLFTLKYFTEGATKTSTTYTKINGEDVIYEKVDDYNVNITLPSYLSKFVTTLGRDVYKRQLLYLIIFGSSALRRTSPIILKLSTVNKIKRPGKTAMLGRSRIYFCAS